MVHLSTSSLRRRRREFGRRSRHVARVLRQPRRPSDVVPRRRRDVARRATPAAPRNDVTGEIRRVHARLQVRQPDAVHVRPAALIGADTRLVRPDFICGWSQPRRTVFTFVPLTLLVVFNWLLISAVRRAAVRRHIMATGNCQTTTTTMTTTNSRNTERRLHGQQRITVRPSSVSLSSLNSTEPVSLVASSLECR